MAVESAVGAAFWPRLITARTDSESINAKHTRCRVFVRTSPRPDNRAYACGSLSRSHKTFGSVKPSSAGLRTQPRRFPSPPACCVISPHCLVVRPSPQQRRPDDCACAIRKNGRMHRPRNSNRCDVDLWYLREPCMYRGSSRLPLRFRILLSPTRSWRLQRERRQRGGHHVTRLFDEDGFDTTRANIQSQK